MADEIKCGDLWNVTQIKIIYLTNSLRRGSLALILFVTSACSPNATPTDSGPPLYASHNSEAYQYSDSLTKTAGAFGGKLVSIKYLGTRDGRMQAMIMNQDDYNKPIVFECDAPACRVTKVLRISSIAPMTSPSGMKQVFFYSPEDDVETTQGSIPWKVSKDVANSAVKTMEVKGKERKGRRPRQHVV